MNERKLVENWGMQKQSHNFQRLRNSMVAEFEFVGQRGHPTLLAMSILVTDGDLEQVTGRYRSYQT